MTNKFIIIAYHLKSVSRFVRMAKNVAGRKADCKDEMGLSGMTIIIQKAGSIKTLDPVSAL